MPFRKQTQKTEEEGKKVRGSNKMSRERVLSEKMKFFIAVIALQFCYSGFHIVSRLVLNMGVSKIVYPVYRNIIALLLLAPFAYFLEKKERPPITFHFLVQCFLLALCGITTNQVFYLLGLNYASPTFASAMQNSVPAITFAMAAALRLEHVNIKRRDGLAKVLGTIVSVGGATIITLYKGPPLLHQEQTSPLRIHDQQQQIMDVINSTTSSNKQNWTLGCLYLLGHCFSWAAWMVFQAPVLRKYPAKLTVTSFTCLFGLLQFMVIALVMETDIQLWKIQSTDELLAILYAGVVASGIVFSLQTWCIDKGGPVSVAVFQPVQTVLVAIMASLLLGDKLYSGGIVGSIFITLGLYAVLWGKKEEKKSWENREIEENVSLSKPLLQEEEAGKSLPQTENAAITIKINP